MKLIFKKFTFIFLFVILFSIPVYASDVIVELDGQRVSFPDQQPIIKDGRTLVPVRGVFEQLGYSIGWDDATQTATLSNDTNTVVIKRWETTFTTNGKSYDLDVPAQTINNRMMIPFRAILESIGCDVDWNGESNVVIVNSGATTIDNVIALQPDPQPTPVQELDSAITEAELNVMKNTLDIVSLHFDAMSSIVNNESLQVGVIEGFDPETMTLADLSNEERSRVISDIRKDNTLRAISILNAAEAVSIIQQQVIEVKYSLNNISSKGSNEFQSFVEWYLMYMESTDDILDALMVVAKDTKAATASSLIVDHAVDSAQRYLNFMEDCLTVMKSMIK